MQLEQLRKRFGDEYPAAVVVNGIWLPLRSERRFVRTYHSPEHNLGSQISRFMDGSAKITASELQMEWHTWSERQRMDFCQECSWLGDQADYPDMLRFVMQHGSPSEWSGVALSVASRLPLDEAFDTLLRALRTAEIGHAANIGQAIALTKHPNAEATLRNHLESIWAHQSLWQDDEFINYVAFEAITCIQHLIELGGDPKDFESRVRQLAGHACAGNRQSCCNFLSKHYDWLK